MIEQLTFEQAVLIFVVVATVVATIGTAIAVRGIQNSAETATRELSERKTVATAKADGFHEFDARSRRCVHCGISKPAYLMGSPAERERSCPSHLLERRRDV